MGKKILNALLLVLYFGYFIFLFYRVFGERKPLDPIMMTGFIFLLFSTLLVIYLIISICRSRYKDGGNNGGEVGTCFFFIFISTFRVLPNNFTRNISRRRFETSIQNYTQNHRKH